MPAGAEALRGALARLDAGSGLEVEWLAPEHAALTSLADSLAACVVVDVQFGVELIAQAKRVCPGAVVVALVRGADAERVALDAGADETVPAGTSSDATVRILRQAAARARESSMLRGLERELREVQSLALLGNWEWDLLSGEVRWSDQLVEMIGRDSVASGMKFEQLLEFVHPEDRQSFQRSVDQALEHSDHYSDCFRVLPASGEIKFIQSRALVVRSEDGSPLRMVGTAQDVTEREHAQQRLRDSEARFRRFVDHAVDAAIAQMHSRA